MKFWDSSALLALVIEEDRSRSCRDLLRADPDVIAWTFAPLEVLGGCCRRRREGAIGAEELGCARTRLASFAKRWSLVGDAPAIRETAQRLLLERDLKTADALQLAAALGWAEERPRGRQLVAGDDKLLASAAAEGFTTIRPA